MEQKQAYQMFSELWLFYKKYSTTPKGAEYWQVMVKDAGEIKERKEAAVEQKQAYQMFSELWLFYKKYSTTPKGAEYWQVMVKDAGEIKERYHSVLCESILLAITKYFSEMEVTK